ncbi:MAG: hypothetical protein U9N10_02810 [Bacillota bacterium]|nr:hypothetical protein [Bacillota bacterium]
MPDISVDTANIRIAIENVNTTDDFSQPNFSTNGALNKLQV